MSVQGEYVRDVVVRADENHASGLAVHAPDVEDVVLGGVRAEHLLVVDQAEPALAGQQDRRHPVKGQVAVVLPETLRTLASSHLHAITSRMEGGANAVCEALALGVPTVSTHIPGSIGLLGQDYPGYFPFGDTEALAQLIDRAETDPIFYQSLTTKCGDRAPLVRPEQEQAAWMQLMDEFED